MNKKKIAVFIGIGAGIVALLLLYISQETTELANETYQEKYQAYYSLHLPELTENLPPEVGVCGTPLGREAETVGYFHAAPIRRLVENYYWCAVASILTSALGFAYAVRSHFRKSLKHFISIMRRN